MSSCLIGRGYTVPLIVPDRLVAQAEASKAIFLHTKPWKIGNHGVLGCPSAGILPIEDVASLRATERFLAQWHWLMSPHFI